jgi:hypothetical protein
MAEFSYTFKSKYSFDTYDDVIKTYAWLKECFEYVFSYISNLKISESFDFSAQKIEYKCHSISEFKENAFGHDIKPDTIFLLAKTEWDSLAHFWAQKIPAKKTLEIVLTSENKSTIVAIKDYLLLSEAEIKQLPYPRRSEKLEDVDNHHVENNTKENTDTVEIKITSTKEPWYTKLIWKIIIPIVVTVIATAICFRLGIL